MKSILSSSFSLKNVLGLILILGLFSCTSSPKKSNQNIVQPTISKTLGNAPQTAQDYIALAQKADIEESIALILKAIPKFIEQQEHKKALWLSQQTLVISNTDRQRYLLNLYLGEALNALGQYQAALEAVELSQSYISDAKQNVVRYYETLAAIQDARGLNIDSLSAQLFALNYQSEQDYQARAMQIWHHLNQLSQWEIEQLAVLSPPHFKGWQQLLNFAHRFGHQPDSFMRYLSQWQRQFSKHPANAIIGDIRPTGLTEANYEENIAVILPLTGKRKAAGEAAQQGVLSAFGFNSNSTLHFIDSNTTNFASLANVFDELRIDRVIGPLLKPNVNTYIANSQLQLPTLLLNLPTAGVLSEHHIALSMTPEEEAIQAATTLSKRNYIAPIVFAQQDTISQRIAKTFTQQWQKVTGKMPEIIHFEDASKVQKKLKSTLEVDLSQKRIDDIDQRIRQKLKTESRNRLDIDMIYIVASPNETRLLKPYIDVNISPFANAIPVFASSRSHSDNSDSSDSRDLTGLTFTEMPWLLKSKQQNKALKKLNEQIWSNRTDSLERIFAMGYDSLSLIRKFAMFKKHPYIRHYGQTGVLKLNDNGILTRSLLWGSYQKDKVEEVAME